MSISASMVKELRERTGVGMMECKKALVETQGDLEKAVELLRKSGQAKAAKKAGRVAAEGVVLTQVAGDNQHGVMIEINSETDFVARDDNFKAFAENVLACVIANRETNIDKLIQLPLTSTSDESVEDARQALVAKIGENIQLRRAVLAEGNQGIVGHYVHGGRIGVLVEVKNGTPELARDIAMHIAASNPEVISPDEISDELIQKETEIFKAQALEQGKPAEIVEKMIGGRINKFKNEISLVGQEFVKEPSITVAALLKKEGAEVVAFQRFELGEGLEKKEENFADEVMAQVRGE